MMKYALRGILFVLALVALNPGSVWAQQHANPCPRPENGSMVSPPPDLYSRNGVLDVSFNYEMGMDDSGRTLFCFVTPDGLESPTLHLNPGDRLNVTLTNANPPPPPGAPTERVSNSSDRCGDALMTITSVNLHFHGTNTSPVCHADEVIHTIVNSHETFQYHVKFPANEPSGLYWYHPHVHGIAEAAVQGGGSGAIVIEGIEKLQPAVAGLPERILLIRDLVVRGNQNDPDVPAWDVSLNYVTIPFPGYRPAMIRMRPGAKEFWRVANASADTIIDLRLRYDGATQPLQVVALDGVPTGSQDGTRQGKIVTEDYIRLPPAARAEFIMTGPAATVADAVFETLKIDTGPDGDNDPTRPLAKDRNVRRANRAAEDARAFLAPSAPNVRRSRQSKSDVGTKAVFLGEAVGPQEPRGSHQLFHHRGWREARVVQSAEPAGDRDYPGRDRGLDYRESRPGKSRISLASNPLFAAGAGRRPRAREPATIARHGRGSVRDRQKPVSQRQGTNGFPRHGYRGFRLPLSYPRARGRRHDGYHPGASAEKILMSRRFIGCKREEMMLAPTRGLTSAARSDCRRGCRAVG
jgi:FtsP/CotA-like multicopper oxidase with cupredoxin domain